MSAAQRIGAAETYAVERDMVEEQALAYRMGAEKDVSVAVNGEGEFLRRAARRQLR